VTRAEQLADAYEAVAHANHYMVGLIYTVTETERDDAEQILITRQNTIAYTDGGTSENYCRLDLALDLIQEAKRTEIRNASRGI
jgi:hypothetical protein